VKLMRRGSRRRRTVEIRVAGPGGKPRAVAAESEEGRRVLAAAQAVLRATTLR
jgi:hypothetical protein